MTLPQKKKNTLKKIIKSQKRDIYNNIKKQSRDNNKIILEIIGIEKKIYFLNSEGPQ